MVAYKEGPAKLNLWVKAERPFMIIIEVTVITPKFEPLSSTPSYVSSPVTSFTLVDFPITYEGLSSTQSIYIRNYSSSVSMFSAMGELDDNVSVSLSLYHGSHRWRFNLENFGSSISNFPHRFCYRI